MAKTFLFFGLNFAYSLLFAEMHILIRKVLFHFSFSIGICRDFKPLEANKFNIDKVTN